MLLKFATNAARFASFIFNSEHGHYYWRGADLYRRLKSVSVGVAGIVAGNGVGEIIRTPQLAYLSVTQPVFAFKHMSEFYLALGLTPRQRAAAFANHYRFLLANLDRAVLDRILFDELPVWQSTVGDAHYGIVLTFSHPTAKEGELSFCFAVDGVQVAVLSFTIVPGEIVGVPAPHSVLVSRLQGFKGHFEEIRLATKALMEADPSSLLLAALQGFAAALSIDHLSSVSARTHICSTGPLLGVLGGAYDDFFDSLGVELSASRFYRSALPVAEKPLTLLKSHRRRRTIAKRQLKHDVAEVVRAAITESRARTR